MFQAILKPQGNFAQHLKITMEFYAISPNFVCGNALICLCKQTCWGMESTFTCYWKVIFFFYLWIWFPLLILFITVFLEIQIKLCGNIIFFLFWYSLCIKHPNLFGKSEKLDLLLDKGLCDSNISITYRKPRPEWLSQHAFIIQVAIFSQSLIVDILCIDDRNLASLFELLLCIICCLLASSF